MKTLVVANQKGGVGKTAILVHLAFDFAERGKKVVIIDLDTQGNASYTLDKYRSDTVASDILAAKKLKINKEKISLISADSGLANIENISLQKAGENLRIGIKQLTDNGYDFCFIDTAPSLGVGLAGALLAADYVLSPIELEAYSIHGIKKMNTTIANLRKNNKKLKFIGMVASKVDARNPRHKRHFEQLKQAFPQFILPVSVGLRSSIADALASGIPVWKIKKTAARKAVTEIRALAEIIYKKME